MRKDESHGAGWEGDEEEWMEDNVGGKRGGGGSGRGVETGHVYPLAPNPSVLHMRSLEVS